MEAALAASEAKSRELADSLRNLNELLEQRVVAETQERVRIWDAARREISEISRHLTMASMVASISHEVSQPLAAVILNADTSLQLLAKPKQDMDDVRAALKDILDDGQRARAVLDGIRSMFRNDHGARTTVTVNDLIAEVLAVVRGELDVHQVSLRSELSNGLPTVLAAPTQLQQVLLNLIMNAIEAMGPVTTQERVLIVKSEIGESGNVQITVEDTGSGIDPSLVDRIFDAFFTTKALGMGMGLSICRQSSISRRPPFGLGAQTQWIEFLRQASSNPAKPCLQRLGKRLADHKRWGPRADRNTLSTILLSVKVRAEVDLRVVGQLVYSKVHTPLTTFMQTKKTRS